MILCVCTVNVGKSEPKKKSFHVKLNIFDYDSVFYINKNVFYYNII